MPVPESVTEAADAVSASLDAAVFVYSGSIDNDGLGRLIEAMQLSDEQPARPNAIMFLTTYGGHAGQAYRIAFRGWTNGGNQRESGTMSTTEQAPKDEQALAWMRDAKRRGQAMIEESERQRIKNRHIKKTTNRREKATAVLDR